MAIATARKTRAEETSRFKFIDIGAGAGRDHQVADGYDADVLIRWGDPVLSDAPAFDPTKQSAATQRQQFGYNNDYLGYLRCPVRPIPRTTACWWSTLNIPALS